MEQQGLTVGQDWQKNCTEFLQEGKKRELAILAIAETTAPKTTEPEKKN